MSLKKEESFLTKSARPKKVGAVQGSVAFPVS